MHWSGAHPRNAAQPASPWNMHPEEDRDLPQRVDAGREAPRHDLAALGIASRSGGDRIELARDCLTKRPQAGSHATTNWSLLVSFSLHRSMRKLSKRFRGSSGAAGDPPESSPSSMAAIAASKLTAQGQHLRRNRELHQYGWFECGLFYCSTRKTTRIHSGKSK